MFGKVKVEVKLDVGESFKGGALTVMPSSNAVGSEDRVGKWGVTLDGDFYVIIPKKDYVFQSLVYWYKTEEFAVRHRTQIIECSGKVGFHVPPDASAVYVGTLVIEGEKDNYRSTPVTLVVKDEYNQAVRRLRKRNPEFSGSIVKSLFRFQGRSGVTRQSPASDAAMSCESRKPIKGFILPII